jgi:glutamine amidotransferase-like uncharacterized protein
VYIRYNKVCKKRGWLRSGLFIVFPLLLSVHCQRVQEPDIALYSGQGCWQESALAFKKMSEWMGHTVKFIDADYINKEGLEDFKILCIPGGDVCQYAQEISLEGKKNIKKFIIGGGGYIGICGGACFAGGKFILQGEELPIRTLELYPSKSKALINEIGPIPRGGMIKVTIDDAMHPITKSEQDSMWIFYLGTPILFQNQDKNMAVLGRYSTGNEPMMIVFEYGEGRVFITGANLEIEVDSYRDGTAPYDELDDKGSDWYLMKKAVLWCLKEIN